MGLTMGEKYTVLDLLYGAMLPSGNDAAETLAEGVGKHKLGISDSLVNGGNSRKYFISEMNRKAQNLGMLDTYFFNPTGLDGESLKKTSFSTVLDLLALGSYALENSTFKEIVKTRVHKIPYKEGYHKALYLENILQLSEVFPGIEGVKPGNSIFARETLMSYINRDGRKLLTVILGSPHTKDDVLKIYKKVFQLDTQNQSGKLGIGKNILKNVIIPDSTGRVANENR
jgi:D-alanyl-D-alanine carboxypeptidase